MKKVFLLAVVSAFASSASFAGDGSADKGCNAPTGNWTEALPRSCLQSPGWLDVGAGMVVIQNVGISQQNGVGNLVTLRAYPFGRWYAPLKSLTPANNSVVEAKLSIAKDANKDAADRKAKAKQATEAFAASKASEDQAKAEGAQADAFQAEAIADKANEDVAITMQKALSDFGNNYAFLKEDDNKVDGLSYWGRHVSFFWGRSVGGFDPKAIDGDINAFGIAFDIAPEFSVVWGRAYFNQAAQAGVANSSSSGTVIGVQVNLKAFKTMRGLTGSM